MVSVCDPERAGRAVGSPLASWPGGVEEEEEDFDCPICQEVLKTPIRTKCCKHVFCRECFRSAVRARGPHCPMCRGPVSETEKRAGDIMQKMRERQGRCRSCGAQKFLSKMRNHYKKCKKYQEEYGISDSTPRPATLPPPAPLPPTTPQETGAGTIDPMHRTWPEVIPLGQGGAYTCPYCPLQTLTDMALVQHCLSCHRGESSPRVCPICVRTAWGDTRYHSHNLIGHLALRHRFSYDNYVNVSEDEESHLYRAIQQSVLASLGWIMRP
ncbi:E3 ubiquitin-protein ligase RNF138-like [Osmerus mordax]|uniref:E3 ubiquitin-protein ligase RNF138-like n=1 Tax=Osmerus mordax TaxID=8014 RepID=UPI00350F5257